MGKRSYVIMFTANVFIINFYNLFKFHNTIAFIKYIFIFKEEPMNWVINTCNFFWEKFFHKIVLSKKTLAVLAVIVFIATTIPLLYLGIFNHASADDFNYSVLTKAALRENSGISAFFAVIGAAVQRAYNNWASWQGTYAMSFLVALRPSIFSDSLTFTHSTILLGISILGVFYFGDAIMRRILKFDASWSIIISCITCFAVLQFTPNANEAFYWYCGGAGYTFFFFLYFIMLGKICLCFYNKKISIGNCIAICLIGFATAGGHFAITLSGFVAISMFLLEALFDKKLDKNFKIRYAIISVVYYIGFVLCVFSPGNSRRQTFFDQQNPLVAIIKSYIKGSGYLKLYTNTIIKILLLFVFVIALFAMKKVKYEFKKPVTFTIITYSMYAVILMPGFFAVNGIPAPRYLDIIYFAVIILECANLIYYAGWIYNKYRAFKENSKYSSFLQQIKPTLVNVIIFVCGFYALWNFSTVDFANSLTMRAITTISSGEAAQFDKEMDEREKMYNDDSIKNVTVKSLTVYPDILYFDDITTDADDYSNYKIAEYYNKESVVRIE